MPPRSAPRARKKEPELFLNRELSWLEFDGRVLEEAEDASNPVLERLKFATIVASNLDEFFMVRVARLKNAVEEGDVGADPAGLSPAQQLQQIAARSQKIVERLYATLTGAILPALGERGIRILGLEGLDEAARVAVARYFQDEVLPALTPLAIDFSRPFPMLASLSLNLAVLLAPAEGEEQPRLAVVQVPSRLPRLVRPPGAGGTTYVLLEEIIRAELPSLFPGQAVVESAAFRVARDSELDLDDEGGRDFLVAVEEELRNRRKSRVVRLEIEAGAGEALLATLAKRLEVAPEDVYRTSGPLDVRAFFPLVDLPALEDLRDPPLKPLQILDPREQEDVFALLDQRDVLVHHPYESFDPVIAFVSKAADDPDVLAIKQTLYRTSGESPVVQALGRAAERGKQVTVLVELMARFDEQSNIRWARSLEESGAHVIYGVRGYKTHAKICLVVRRGRQGIKRYVHLGTGNYNDRTARLYTDFGLMTADPVLGEDASAFFNALTGYSDPPRMKKLVMAPTMLREQTLRLIERERRRAEAGQAGEITAKMNALVDEDIIRALYDASKAGVRIRLNVRGICCLRPSVKGLSETIEVVSIVDRFLEHARIVRFRNGGDEEVYLSSADWMPRNLDRRVELLFPVEAPECRQKVLAALDAMFTDNAKARRLQADGTYKRRRPAKGEEPFRAQLHLHREAQRALERGRGGTAVTLEPLTSPAKA
jgi:polyphosphate kinase